MFNGRDIFEIISKIRTIVQGKTSKESRLCDVVCHMIL